MKKILRGGICAGFCWMLLVQVCLGQFVNNTASWGLSTPAGYNSAVLGRGHCWADFDGDGDLDLFAPSSGRLNSNGNPAEPFLLYRCNGATQFNVETVYTPASFDLMAHATVAADFDNDGDQDVFVATGGWIRPHTANLLFINDGTGSFTEEASLRGLNVSTHMTMCATWGDYDRDGYLDLYLGNYETSALPGTNTGISAPNQLFRNQRDGTFKDVTVATNSAADGGALAVLWVDYNDDMWPDLMIGNDRGKVFPPCKMLRNNKGQGFSDVSVAIHANAPIAGMCATQGDIECDGDFDFYFSADGNQHTLLIWDQLTKQFQAPIAGLYAQNAINSGISNNQVGWSSHFYDHDNDGDVDLLMATATAPIRYFENDGTGNFTDQSLASGIANQAPPCRSTALLDIDNDGDLDLYIAGQTTTGQLVENHNATGFNWLTIKLQGSNSNRDGQGARLALTTPLGTQLRRRASGEGYLSDGDPRIHFGLGTATIVQDLEIRWPSGTVSYHPSLAINQHHTIIEPSFQISGSMTPGSANSIVLDFPAELGQIYWAGIAVNPLGAVTLPDYRQIHVDLNDPVLALTSTPQNPYLWGCYGNLTLGGTAMIYNIPNLPQLSGILGKFIAVTFDFGMPGSIRSILGPQWDEIR